MPTSDLLGVSGFGSSTLIARASPTHRRFGEAAGQRRGGRCLRGAREPAGAVALGLRGRPVVVLACDLDVRVLSEDGELLRHLTLDPSKDYQPVTGGP